MNLLLDYPLSLVSESPETTAARALPQDVIDLLDRKSRRDTYTEGLRIGQNIVNTYLSCSPRESLSTLDSVLINPGDPDSVFQSKRKLTIKFIKK